MQPQSAEPFKSINVTRFAHLCRKPLANKKQLKAKKAAGLIHGKQQKKKLNGGSNAEVVLGSSKAASLLLSHQAVVVLRSMASGHSLRVAPAMDGSLDARGASGKLAKFRVERVSDKVVRLQSVAIARTKNSSQTKPKSPKPKRRVGFLRINKDLSLDARGKGGWRCNFQVVDLPDGTIALESCVQASKPKKAAAKPTDQQARTKTLRVGALPSGQLKKPEFTGRGLHGRFQVTLVSKNPAPAIETQQEPAASANTAKEAEPFSSDCCLLDNVVLLPPKVGQVTSATEARKQQ